ncbi:MAG TPA: sodium transporter, partial [Pseudomonas sp.]|nr:sodium transporter [Pseudomonas sp.]
MEAAKSREQAWPSGLSTGAASLASGPPAPNFLRRCVPFVRSLHLFRRRGVLTLSTSNDRNNNMLDLLIVLAFVFYGLSAGMRARSKAS